MSTRLNLLLPIVHSEDRGRTDAAQTDCCNNSSQCVYLEKLLGMCRFYERQDISEFDSGEFRKLTKSRTTDFPISDAASARSKCYIV